jgi:16S rRNA (guanine966-N2)-methyltransferase
MGRLYAAHHHKVARMWSPTPFLALLGGMDASAITPEERGGAGSLGGMRVVGGVAGGRRLRAPTGRSIRPTSDRVREGVFNVLTSLGAVEGATVVDLFAGTGALGIEALSRGAAQVTFVDRDPVAIATIGDNLASVGLAGAQTEVVRADALAWLERGRPEERAREESRRATAGREGSRRAFDLALCDPPYDFAAWERLLGGLSADLAVLESSLPLEPSPGWVVRTTKRYGGTVVTLVQPLPHQVARKGAS